MARYGTAGLGILLLVAAIAGYFWQTDTGYTYPTLNNICNSDSGQLAQWWFGGDAEIRKVCNEVAMITFGIYGAGLIGLILTIVGAVAKGGPRLDAEGRPEIKEENNSLEILKERYAKGEITKDEFDKMKEDLENS